MSILELHFDVGYVATKGAGFQGDAGSLLRENFPAAHVITSQKMGASCRKALGEPWGHPLQSCHPLALAQFQDIPVTD